MLDTLDFLELLSMSPREALIKIITHNNEVSYNPDYLSLGIPEKVSGRVTNVEVKGSSVVNPFEKQFYDGTFLFTYKRIDLAELFATTELSIQMDLPCKTSDVVAVLSHHYGYVFDSSDYVNEAITVYNATEYVLKAAPYSYRWCGQVKLTLLKKTPLTQVTVTTDLGRMVGGVEHREYMQLVKNFTDGRAYGKFLKDVPLGMLSSTSRMRDILQKLYYQIGDINNPWVFSIYPTYRNLQNARVVYNGRAVDVGVVPYTHTVSRVLIIELDDDLNKSIRGQLVINYNAQLGQEIRLTPRLGYRYPAELLGGVLDGSGELTHFGELYEGSILNDSSLDVSFMDRILNAQPGTFTCSPTPSKYNLYNATVEYMGRNINYPESFNLSLNLVWVLRLDPEYCTHIGGRLLIYYKR